MDAKITPVKIAYHRNGISGEPFHVVTFYELYVNPNSAPLMVGIVFAQPGHVAVLDVSLLANSVIEFAQNSWRGDVFEGALRQAIQEWEDAQETAALAQLAQIAAQKENES